MVVSLIALTLSACNGAPQAKATIDSARFQDEADGRHLVANLQLQFSNTMFEALEHGVPLTLSFELQRDQSHALYQMQLRYAALANVYELAMLNDSHRDDQNTLSVVRSFGSRGQLEAALDQINFVVTDREAKKCRLKMQLNTAILPAPLRLPALLDDNWRGLTSEYTWPCAA